MYSYVLTGRSTGKADWTMDKALIEIRMASSINPLPIYKQMEGDILFAMKDYEGAFKAYEEVSRTNMASPAVFFSAAKSKQLAGADSQEVIALMDSCIAYCPKPIIESNAGYLLERAQMYMNTEQYRQALADYDTYFTALKENVNDIFYYYREQAAFYGKQFQRALNDINKAIELAPNNAAYRLELGVVNLRVGRYDEALEALDKSISMEATGDAYRLKGVALMQLKKNAEACESFAKAKELGDTLVEDLIKKNCQ